MSNTRTINVRKLDLKGLKWSPELLEALRKGDAEYAAALKDGHFQRISVSRSCGAPEVLPEFYSRFDFWAEYAITTIPRNDGDYTDELTKFMVVSRLDPTTYYETTVDELAEHFGISAETIRNDVRGISVTPWRINDVRGTDESVAAYDVIKAGEIRTKDDFVEPVADRTLPCMFMGGRVSLIELPDGTVALYSDDAVSMLTKVYRELGDVQSAGLHKVDLDLEGKLLAALERLRGQPYSTIRSVIMQPFNRWKDDEVGEEMADKLLDYCAQVAKSSITHSYNGWTIDPDLLRKDPQIRNRIRVYRPGERIDCCACSLAHIINMWGSSGVGVSESARIASILRLLTCGRNYQIADKGFANALSGNWSKYTIMTMRRNWARNHALHHICSSVIELHTSPCIEFNKDYTAFKFHNLDNGCVVDFDVAEVEAKFIEGPSN